MAEYGREGIHGKAVPRLPRIRRHETRISRHIFALPQNILLCLNHDTFSVRSIGNAQTRGPLMERPASNSSPDIGMRARGAPRGAEAQDVTHIVISHHRYYDGILEERLIPLVFFVGTHAGGSIDGDWCPPRQASHGAYTGSRYGTLVLLLSRPSNDSTKHCQTKQGSYTAASFVSLRSVTHTVLHPCGHKIETAKSRPAQILSISRY